MVSMKRWFAALVFVLAYLLVGGAIFMALESPAEIEQQREIRTLRTQIYEAFVWNNVSVDHAGREELLERLVSASKFSSLIGPGDPLLRWNMFNSFFFAVTVTTTIGYGHMVPSTSTGRIFCMVFALIGIPVNAKLLANLGDYFAAKLIKRSRLWSNQKHRQAKLEVFLFLFLCLIPGVVIFFVLPAGIFTKVESWAYVDAFYYSFISLTTIGFGDFVAGQSEGEPWLWMYRTVLIIWIVFGLGFLATVINVVKRGLKSKPLKSIETKILSSTRLMSTKKLRLLSEEDTVMSFMPVYNNRPEHTTVTLVRTGTQSLFSDNVIPQNTDAAKSNLCPPLARRSSKTALNEIDCGSNNTQHTVSPMHSENLQIPDNGEDLILILSLTRSVNHTEADEENALPSFRDRSDPETDEEDAWWENEGDIFYMEADEENVNPAAPDTPPRRRVCRSTSVHEEQEVVTTLPLLSEGTDKDDTDLAQGKKAKTDEQISDAGIAWKIVSDCCNTQPRFGSVPAWICSRTITKSMEYSCSYLVHNNNPEKPKTPLDCEVSVDSSFFRNPAPLFGFLMNRQPEHTYTERAVDRVFQPTERNRRSGGEYNTNCAATAE